MAVRGKVETWHMAAGEALDDLTPGTGDIFKAIALDDGKPAANGSEAGGLLTEGGGSGEHVTLAVSGVSKFIAGAAIAKGAKVTCTASGYLITATSGTYVIGRNLDTAVGSGAVGTGFFNFANPAYVSV